MLDNFAQLREPGRPRAEYLEQVSLSAPVCLLSASGACRCMPDQCWVTALMQAVCAHIVLTCCVALAGSACALREPGPVAALQPG